MSNHKFEVNLGYTNKQTNKKRGWPLVAHTCNPSYSRGRGQEDLSWNPAWTNSS
jgi:hypothetical protein